MERQLLIIITASFLIFGCQQIDLGMPGSAISIEEQKPQVIVVEEKPQDVWEYMMIKTDLSPYILDEQTNFYINKHISDLEKFTEYLDKSYYFIYYVIQELEAADLPIELALIPFIESVYAYYRKSI